MSLFFSLLLIRFNKDGFLLFITRLNWFFIGVLNQSFIEGLVFASQQKTVKFQRGFAENWRGDREADDDDDDVDDDDDDGDGSNHSLSIFVFILQ